MNPLSVPVAESLLLSSYDYSLPQHRIALFPVTPRHTSKLLHVSCAEHSLKDVRFLDFPRLLKKGDVLVINNTRVIPARLKSNRGEVLLVRNTGDSCWDCLVFPGKRFKPGTLLELEGGLTAEVLSLTRAGRLIRFDGDLKAHLQKYGSMPLPPYIERETERTDKMRYQTIFARIPGSVAAPTAGLHFTRRVLDLLAERGIGLERITLHVGPGTFRPVKSENIESHRIDPESYSCAPSAWRRIQSAARVIAVGTTTTRALETIAATGETTGTTDLFIYPGYRFRIVQGLVTNFHLPRSSLLMLVSAFVGLENVRLAYQHAISHNYRFYSYGDAMLVL